MAVTVSRETHPRITLKGANSGTVNSGILVGSGDGNRVSMTFTATAEPIIVIPEGPVSDAQLEAGSFPTSYIPNTADSGTVTRSPDIASIPVSAFGYNQAAGTVVVEYQRETGIGGTTVRIAELESDILNRITIWNGSPGIAASVYIRTSAGTQTDASTDNVATAGVNKLGVALAEDDIAFSLNGGTVQTDSTASIPAVTGLTLGDSHAAGILNGHIKSIQYYPRRLTNTQLQELTS